MTKYAIETLTRQLRMEHQQRSEFAHRMTASAQAAQRRRIYTLIEAIEILKEHNNGTKKES